jgi:hypothetical protein
MWWNLSYDIVAANLEAHRVIALRLMKLAQGGPAAQMEAQKMVSEKMAASAEAAAMLGGGGSLASVVRRYRTIIRANGKRLSGANRRRRTRASKLGPRGW